MSELVRFREFDNIWSISNKNLRLDLTGKDRENLIEDENAAVSKSCIREVKSDEIYYALVNKKAQNACKIWFDKNGEQRREYHYCKNSGIQKANRVVIFEKGERSVVRIVSRPIWEQLLDSVEEFFTEKFFKTTFLGARIDYQV